MTSISLPTILTWLLLGLGLASLLAGFILISRHATQKNTLRPVESLRANLARQIKIERLIYRHHRKAGWIVIACSTVSLWLLSPAKAWQFFISATQEYLLIISSNHFWLILVESVLIMITFFFGLLLIIRPSLLRPLEKIINKPLLAASAQRRMSNEKVSPQKIANSNFAVGLLLFGAANLVLGLLIYLML